MPSSPRSRQVNLTWFWSTKFGLQARVTAGFEPTRPYRISVHLRPVCLARPLIAKLQSPSRNGRVTVLADALLTRCSTNLRLANRKMNARCGIRHAVLTLAEPCLPIQCQHRSERVYFLEGGSLRVRELALQGEPADVRIATEELRRYLGKKVICLLSLSYRAYATKTSRGTRSADPVAVLPQGPLCFLSSQSSRQKGEVDTTKAAPVQKTCLIQDFDVLVLKRVTWCSRAGYDQKIPRFILRNSKPMLQFL